MKRAILWTPNNSETGISSESHSQICYLRHRDNHLINNNDILAGISTAISIFYLFTFFISFLCGFAPPNCFFFAQKNNSHLFLTTEEIQSTLFGGQINGYHKLLKLFFTSSRFQRWCCWTWIQIPRELCKMEYGLMVDLFVWFWFIDSLFSIQLGVLFSIILLIILLHLTDT